MSQVSTANFLLSVCQFRLEKKSSGCTILFLIGSQVTQVSTANFLLSVCQFRLEKKSSQVLYHIVLNRVSSHPSLNG